MKIVNIKEFRESKEIEKDYQSFLTYINKEIKPPKTIPELGKVFYFVLRYLEGTVNCFTILLTLGMLDYKHSKELKSMVINYLENLIKDLKD
jgi:hypothetical protein